MLVIALLSTLVGLCYPQPSANFNPTRPVLSPRLCFQRNENRKLIRYISDQQTKCMYWECTAGRPIPRQCGLQTFISEFYEGDEYNPCTETYVDTNLQFDCTRKGFDPNGNPECQKQYEDRGVCKNGARVVSQGNLCWCECAPGFSGYNCATAIREPVGSPPDTNTDTEEAERRLRTSSLLRRMATRRRNRQRERPRNEDSDDDDTGPVLPDNRPLTLNLQLDDETDGPASTPIEFAEDDDDDDDNGAEKSSQTGAQSTRPLQPRVRAQRARVDENGKFQLGDPCPNGAERDFCTEMGGCLNGGTCVNQCLGATCLCKPPYVAGRRCEQFQCTIDVECMNGGTCSRGPSGINPVATCTCLPGFGGPMCELNLIDNN